MKRSFHSKIVAVSGLFVALLISISTISAQTVQRIDPANWWVGMKYNTLTLMVYGDSIGHLSPSVSHTGVTLIETITVENPNYLFIKVEISNDATPGDVTINFANNNTTVTSKIFPLFSREPGSADRKGFDASDVTLLIMPDRFANGDPTNDSAPDMMEGPNRDYLGGRYGGDLQGIIDRLDYIRSMGYTQIWNTPAIENNMARYSYHGYSATDFYRIDPRLGTNELFRELVREARKRDIGLIWDVVLNHSGSEHFFIKDLPSSDWVNNPDKTVLTNHLKTTLLDPYASELDRKAYTDGWFVTSMPDLNQRNPLMAAYLTQNTIWWAEYAGLSGFRVDTYSYADKEFLTEWTKAIMDEYPNFNIVGEEWTNLPQITSYWQRGKQNPDGYISYLPSIMDFALGENVTSALNGEMSWASTWKDVYESLAMDFHFPDPHNLVIFPDNHDMDRFFTQIEGNFDHWKLGIALYATMRGIPQFLYGNEILMSNTIKGNHGDIREEFPGGWSDHSADATTGKGLSHQKLEAQQYFAKLMNWRRDKLVIHSGNLLHFGPQRDDVYVYFRYNKNELMMIALNKNDEVVTLDLKRYAEILPQSFEANEVVSGRTIRAEGTISIPAKTPFILEIR